MPDGFTWGEWQREKTRPLTRREQEVLAGVASQPTPRYWNLHGGNAAIGYLLTERKLVVPTAIDRHYSVTATPTAFGKLVAHAHEAVNLCHAHPLDHEPRSLFKMDCPECNGTGAEEPDCWLCKGERRIKAHAAYRHGYKKADLEDLEDDGWCDCPACDGDHCEQCAGDGVVPADYLFREAQRILLTVGNESSGPFPVIRWYGGNEGGVIDEHDLLSPAAHGWLCDLGLSIGRFGDYFSEWVSLSHEGEAAARVLLEPTAAADLVRMWQAGEPWRLPERKFRDGLFRPNERDQFEEHAAFYRCHARGWITHDYRRSGFVWTDGGREAVAGWDGAEIRLERERLDDPANALRIMESVSHARRAVAEAERAVIASAEMAEVAQARLEAAADRGDQKEVERQQRRLRDALNGIFTRNYRRGCEDLEHARRNLAWALQSRARQEGLVPTSKDHTNG